MRPRGWFEVRYLDAQPWRWWPVPVAVLTALLEDAEAPAPSPRRACAGLDDWAAAARDGLAAPGLQAAALACFDAALTRCGAAASTPTSSRWSPRSATATSPAAAARPTTPTSTLLEDLVTTLPGTSPDVADRGPTLKQYVADELERGRDRSLGLTTGVLDEAELLAQHSPLMSPLVWDLAHIGNYEELWLLREAAGVEAMRPELDDLYDAFEHPRADPADAAAAARPPRPATTSALVAAQGARRPRRAPARPGPRAARRAASSSAWSLQHEHQHDETMLATHQLRRGDPVLPGHRRAAGARPR